MTQEISSHHSPTSTIASRLRGISPHNKVLFGSAFVLTIFMSVAAAGLRDDRQQHSVQPASQITTDISNNLENPDTEFAPEAMHGETKVEAKIDVQSSSDEGSGAVNPQVELEVNGQNVPVPENGEVSETITNNEDNSSVQVNVHSNLTQSGSSDRTRIQIDSESESEVRIRTRN